MYEIYSKCNISKEFLILENKTMYFEKLNNFLSAVTIFKEKLCIFLKYSQISVKQREIKKRNYCFHYK